MTAKDYVMLTLLGVLCCLMLGGFCCLVFAAIINPIRRSLKRKRYLKEGLPLDEDVDIAVLRSLNEKLSFINSSNFERFSYTARETEKRKIESLFLWTKTLDDKTLKFYYKKWLEHARRQLAAAEHEAKKKTKEDTLETIKAEKAKRDEEERKKYERIAALKEILPTPTID